uniref:S4 domain-containing protein n=1 Tax=Panagrellus redivivus TaxID=6233 RepID=A0A7E4VB74_PANRE
MFRRLISATLQPTLRASLRHQNPTNLLRPILSTSAPISTSSTLLAKKQKRRKGQKEQTKAEFVEVDDDEEDGLDDEVVDEKTALAAKGILHTGVGDAEELIDDGLPKDYKRKSHKLNSRRLDTLLNRTSGRSSAEVEKMILSGRVRVNDVPVKKKAYNINKRDEIDLWLDAHPDNAALAYVTRVKIVDYVLKQHGYDIDCLLWSKMLVDNWRHAPEGLADEG